MRTCFWLPAVPIQTLLRNYQRERWGLLCRGRHLRNSCGTPMAANLCQRMILCHVNDVLRGFQGKLGREREMWVGVPENLRMGLVSASFVPLNSTWQEQQFHGEFQENNLPCLPWGCVGKLPHTQLSTNHTWNSKNILWPYWTR